MRAWVCGASGFLGQHLVRRLKAEGYVVIGADHHQRMPSAADTFYLGDLRDRNFCSYVSGKADADEIYQMGARHGGIAFTGTGAFDADILRDSMAINLNMVALRTGAKLFFPSSACVYPGRNLQDPEHPICSEESAYPAAPDSEYGWEKLFAERLYQAHARKAPGGLRLRIARFHTIYGPDCKWHGGHEKVTPALARKVATCPDGGSIEIWGDGEQTRSFLYVDEAIDGVRALMKSDYAEPLNIGSDEMVTINHLAELLIDISGKSISLRHVDGPQGVRGRNSDNRRIREVLGWAPSMPLRVGLERLYWWVQDQVIRHPGQYVGSFHKIA